MWVVSGIFFLSHFIRNFAHTWVCSAFSSEDLESPTESCPTHILRPRILLSVYFFGEFWAVSVSCVVLPFKKMLFSPLAVVYCHIAMSYSYVFT